MKKTQLLMVLVLAFCTIVLASKHVHFKIHVPVIKKEIHHEKVIYKHIKNYNHKESHYDHHHGDEGGFGGQGGGFGGHEGGFGGNEGGFGGNEGGFGGHDGGFGGNEGGYGGDDGGYGGDQGGFGGHEGGGYEDHENHHVEYSDEGGHGWDEK